MKRFAQLFSELDSATATLAKVAALKRYFAEAPAADAAWATYFLAGGKPRQTVPTALLRRLACERAGIADWLFEASYQAVGDLAETIALVLPTPAALQDIGLAEWVEQRLLPLRGLPEAAQAERILQCWDQLDAAGRFLLTKLIGGGFRVGVSKLLVQRALAEQAGLDPKQVAQRMMGWTDKTARPSAEAFEQLRSAHDLPQLDSGQPYPFFLAHPLSLDTAELADRLGPPSDWLVEWKYDGIRAQLVRRAGQTWVWSRGEELVTERFPEVVALAAGLPDGTVLDGEILAWQDGAPAPFALLQQRIGRKTLSRRLLAEVPVQFLAYDLLAWQGEDVRDWPQLRRRQQLEAVAAAHALPLSPRVTVAAEAAGLAEGPGATGAEDLSGAAGWAALARLREQSRERGVEGFMLKHHAARYGQGRRKQADLDTGTWWKWKIAPLTVDAVLVYAQAGHGRRASVYTDYTFAVWNRPPRDAAEVQAVVEAIAARRPAPPLDSGELQLVPFAKAYSGLSDAEFARVDKTIRRDTLEKFGPVRSVRPSLLFELGFEGINRSSRHKSGIAVRFPRMLRIRDDKPIHEADTLATLEAWLPGGEGVERG